MRGNPFDLLLWLGAAVLVLVLLWRLMHYLEQRRRWRDNHRKRKDP